MTEFISAVLKYLSIFIVVWVVISYFISPRRTFDNITNTWYQAFSNQQFSSKEFYSFVEQAIKEKKMKYVSMNRVWHSDNTSFSSRLYLQILRNDQMILVCAADFGTDFFISWRQGQPINIIQDMTMRLPGVGKWIAAFIYRKTFYEMDTDAMFKESVQQCVQKAIGRLTSNQAERVPITPSNEGSQPNSVPV